MLELLRLLSQLRPRFRPLPGAPFEVFAQWCIGQGLGPLVGHNLEYALPQLPAPRAAKDKLLSVFQGTLADNTLHLVNLRKTLGPLQGRRLVLFGTLSLAEALYPHVGFRPLLEVSVLVGEEDIGGFAGYMRAQGYVEEVPLPHVALGLSDGCTPFGIFTRLPGVPHMPPQLQAFPKPVFGPSVFSLGMEDNLLALCARQYDEAYVGPWVDWVDMREGCLSLEVEAQSFKAKAAGWKVAYAAYASLAVLGRLFEEVEVGAFQPEVPAAWKPLVHRWADAYVGLPEAVAEGRQEAAQEEERRAFEAMASSASLLQQ
jgi:hypothetical protein